MHTHTCVLIIFKKKKKKKKKSLRFAMVENVLNKNKPIFNPLIFIRQHNIYPINSFSCTEYSAIHGVFYLRKA